MMALVILGLMLLLLFLGYPMKVPLTAAAMVTVLVWFPRADPSTLVQQMIGGVEPGRADRGADVHLRGRDHDARASGRSPPRPRLALRRATFAAGLPITTAVSCTLFGALSGSTQATVVAIGGPLRPEMLAAGYPDSFTTALIINASDIALLIPPSIGMIVYGVVSGTSIGELFIAGIGPGLLILVLFCALLLDRHAAVGHRRRSPSATWPERWTAVERAMLPLGFPVIIIGGIYAGIFSPTEAAAVSVLYAALLEIGVYRELKLTRPPEARALHRPGHLGRLRAGRRGRRVQLGDLLRRSCRPSSSPAPWASPPRVGYATIMATIAVAYLRRLHVRRPDRGDPDPHADLPSGGGGGGHRSGAGRHAGHAAGRHRLRHAALRLRHLHGHRHLPAPLPRGHPRHAALHLHPRRRLGAR